MSLFPRCPNRLNNLHFPLAALTAEVTWNRTSLGWTICPAGHLDATSRRETKGTGSRHKTLAALSYNLHLEVRKALGGDKRVGRRRPPRTRMRARTDVRTHSHLKLLWLLMRPRECYKPGSASFWCQAGTGSGTQSYLPWKTAICFSFLLDVNTEFISFECY